MSGEYPTDFWLERSLFAGLALGNMAFGIHLAVFITTIYYLHRTLKSERPMSVWSFLYVFVMFTLGTIDVASTIKLYQRMWIDMRDIVGGPTAFLATHFNDPFNTLGTSCYIIGLFFQDSMLLYRLLMIWDFWYPIIILPVLGLIASTTLSILTVIASSKPGSGPWTQSTIVFAVPFCSITVGFNIAMTLAIAGRMFYLRQKVTRTLGPQHGKTYTSIASMFVESGAIYSVVGLLFIVSYARKSNVQNLFLPILEQSICIASELIMLRIALGRAWTRQTVTQAHVGHVTPLSGSHSSRTQGYSGTSVKSDKVLGSSGVRGRSMNNIHTTRTSISMSDTIGRSCAGCGGSRENSVSDTSSIEEKAIQEV